MDPDNIIHNTLDFVFLSAGFYCETSMWHIGFTTAQFSQQIINQISLQFKTMLNIMQVYSNTCILCHTARFGPQAFEFETCVSQPLQMRALLDGVSCSRWGQCKWTEQVTLDRDTVSSRGQSLWTRSVAKDGVSCTGGISLDGVSQWVTVEWS